MAARAIWKAAVQFGPFRLPVKLYSAVEDRTVRFHLLHDQDMTRLKQRLINPNTGTTVPYQQMLKGYEVERDTLVVFDNEDLESLEPAASRSIEVQGFFDPRQLNHQWYDRPYWLGPDGDAQEYFAFARALADQEVEGVARWTMRKKDYVGAIRSVGGYLALITLRRKEEIISADELDPPAGRSLDSKERELAGQLLAALEADFDASDYKDEYRNRLLQLIETKQRGGKVEVEHHEEAAPPKSLAESLQASLQGVG